MSEKENNFFKIVNEEANRHNSVFFLKNGEGRELITDKFDGEDLFGWLIPLDKANKFKEELKLNLQSDKWDDFLTFAIWEEKDNNSIKIDFKSNF